MVNEFLTNPEKLPCGDLSFQARTKKIPMQCILKSNRLVTRWEWIKTLITDTIWISQRIYNQILKKKISFSE